jgi:hypothetical protein
MTKSNLVYSAKVLVIFAMLGWMPGADAGQKRTPSMTQDDQPTNPIEKAQKNTGVVVLDQPDFSLQINGFAQFRYTLLKPENKPLSQTFDLALARIAFSGEAFSKAVSYFFQFNASTLGNTNQVSLIDGWLSYHVAPELSIQGGRFVLPYSREFYTHPGNLLTTDLSIADYAFNLPRSMGVMLSGHVLERVTYSVAALNSVRALDGSGQENPNNQVASLARLELDVLKPYGYLESSPKLVDEAELSFGVAGAINPVADSSAFQNTVAGDTTYNLTVDGGYRYERLSIQSAGYMRYTYGGLQSAASHDWGAYAQTGFYLVPEKFEAALRYSRVNFGNQVNTATTAGNSKEYTVGLNNYFHGHNLKLQSDFSWIDQSQFQSGSTLNKQFRIQAQILF